jgi:hypothetical protein
VHVCVRSERSNLAICPGRLLRTRDDRDAARHHMLLFRALVIRQRIVNVTFSDQKLLCASSACSCAIAIVLSVSFNQSQSNPTLAPNTSPQYTVLALLAFQLLVHTFIRLRATEVSFFDNAVKLTGHGQNQIPALFQRYFSSESFICAWQWAA